VAARTQKHVCGPVCIKYDDTKKQKKVISTTCRFGCPWRCHDKTHIDKETDNINLHWQDPRLNKYNRYIASALRFNHDFCFLPTKTRALLIIHYMSNYTTKFETPIYQRVALISIVADDEAKKRTGQVTEVSTLGATKKFMHRVFNKICTERELSAVEVCSYLLGHSFDYSSISDKRWAWVHPGTLFWCIVRHWRLLRQAVESEDECHDEGDERGGDEIDQLRLTSNGARPTIFSAYLSRGTDLKSLCFYDYISLIKVAKKSGKYGYSASFDFTKIPQLESFTQRVRSVEDIAVPVFSTTLARTGETTPKFWYNPVVLDLYTTLS